MSINSILFNIFQYLKKTLKMTDIIQIKVIIIIIIIIIIIVINIVAVIIIISSAQIILVTWIALFIGYVWKQNSSWYKINFDL